MMSGWVRRIGLVVVLSLSAGVAVAEDSSAEPALESLVVYAAPGPQHLRVELARSAEERSRGLMERDHLAADAGMLFLYHDVQSPRSGFWMYRTRIPLDIAFIGEDERIAAIHTMQPCKATNPAQCPVTYPGVRYRAALEVNAGVFAALDIGEGDCVSWPGSSGACRPEALESDLVEE